MVCPKGLSEQNAQKARQPTEKEMLGLYGASPNEQKVKQSEVSYYDNGDGLAIIFLDYPNNDIHELLRSYAKWRKEHPDRYEHRTREDYEVISPGGYIYERIAIFYNAPADSLQNK